MHKEYFGTWNGQTVSRYTLTNHAGTKIQLSDFGATWLRFQVPAANGLRDLILTSPQLQDYVADSSHHGHSIGPTAGRIPATFSLQGQPVTIIANDHSMNMHGGPNGFDHVVWEATPITNGIQFRHAFAPDITHFPGTLTASIRYTLDDDQKVTITYTGQTDTPTLFNPTSHVYFNFNTMDQTIANHILQVNADQRVILATDKAPTLRNMDVVGTAYDLTTPIRLGDVFKRLVDQPEGGLDEIYLQTAPASPLATLAFDGYQLTITADRKAAIVYTANGWDDRLPLLGKTSGDHIGIAIEPQTDPRALAAFTLLPGTPVSYTTTYQLSQSKP